MNNETHEYLIDKLAKLEKENDRLSEENDLVHAELSLTRKRLDESMKISASLLHLIVDDLDMEIDEENEMAVFHNHCIDLDDIPRVVKFAKKVSDRIEEDNEFSISIGDERHE